MNSSIEVLIKPKNPYNKPVKFINIPHCADRSIFKDYKLPKTHDILLVGAIHVTSKLGRHYPLREKMLDILPESVFSNPNLKWLDPANGIGNFPICCYFRLMNGLKNVISDTTKRSKHIIEKMLYMVEVNAKNNLECRKLFKKIDFSSKPNLISSDF